MQSVSACLLKSFARPFAPPHRPATPLSQMTTPPDLIHLLTPSAPPQDGPKIISLVVDNILGFTSLPHTQPDPRSLHTNTPDVITVPSISRDNMLEEGIAHELAELAEARDTRMVIVERRWERVGVSCYPLSFIPFNLKFPGLYLYLLAKYYTLVLL